MAESYINYIKLPNGDVAKFSLPNVLTVGNQTYDGSVGITITAADLGLSQALKLIGVTSTALVDGAITNPIVVDGKSYTPSIGDVVLSADKNSEFAWVKGNYWEELGSENSYALKTVTISAGTGLSGGGSLASNRTLSINYAGDSPVMNGTSNAGSSNYPARADHVHPSDISKFNVSGGTITGATIINNTLTVSNTATFSNKTKIGGRLVLTSNTYGTSLPSGTFDTGTIFFKLI